MRGLFSVFLVLSSAFADAQSQTFGQWASGRQSSGSAVYAATVNDSGNVLGQYCYLEGDSCVYLLGIRQTCTKGNKYPVLANSDKGSQTLSLLCNGPLESGLHQYVFTDFDDIHKTVLEAYRVGFAIPLKGDEFVVVRFSLVGSNEAIAAMNKAYSSQTPARRGTRDQRL